MALSWAASACSNHWTMTTMQATTNLHNLNSINWLQDGIDGFIRFGLVSVGHLDTMILQYMLYLKTVLLSSCSFCAVPHYWCYCGDRSCNYCSADLHSWCLVWNSAIPLHQQIPMPELEAWALLPQRAAVIFPPTATVSTQSTAANRSRVWGGG